MDPHRSNASDLRLVSFTRPCAADYTLWTTEFIHGPRGLWNWISSHGNWVSKWFSFLLMLLSLYSLLSQDLLVQFICNFS